MNDRNHFLSLSHLHLAIQVYASETAEFKNRRLSESQEIGITVKLRKLVILGSCFLSFLGVLASVTIIFLYYKLSDGTRRLDTAATKVFAAEELTRSLRAHSREDFLFEVAGSDQYKSVTSDSNERISYWAAQIQKPPVDESENKLIGKVQVNLGNYLTESQHLVTEKLPPLESYRKLSKSLRPSITALDALITFNIEERDRTKIEMDSTLQSARNIALLVAVLLIAGVGIFIVGMTAALYRPIAKISAALGKITSGEYQPITKPSGAAELKDIAQTFNRMVSTLTTQKETQLSFLTAVAHDLRTPLGAIKMSCELMADDETLTPNDRKSILEILRNQSIYLERMVGDLLDKTRIESGKFDLQPELIDLRSICSATTKLFAHLSDRHEITTSLPQTALLSHCDPVRIGQIANNLMSNAIKYSPEGGRVELRLEERDGHAIISVEDEGIGILISEQDHLFEPFRRSRAAKETASGVGLGLSVAQRLAKAHQGKITFESRAGLGSTFLLWLPLANKSSGDTVGSDRNP